MHKAPVRSSSEVRSRRIEFHRRLSIFYYYLPNCTIVALFPSLLKFTFKSHCQAACNVVTAEIAGNGRGAVINITDSEGVLSRLSRDDHKGGEEALSILSAQDP